MDREKRLQQIRDAVKKHDQQSCDRINVRLPKGSKAAILSTGRSVNSYVVEAVLEKMARDNLSISGK